MASWGSERQHLLSSGSDEGASKSTTCRQRLYDFLEAKTRSGMVLEAIIALVIILNVVCFMLSTEHSLENNTTAWRVFDGVEICTVALFTAEYILRFYSVVEATDSKGRPLYTGCQGRIRWAVTDFYSWVDLASILPFYVDLLLPQDLPATQFIRLARMLRMMKEGGFEDAFKAFDDIFARNSKLVVTSVFVGLTTWLMLSSLNYVAQRHNPDMIWTYPSCYSEYSDDDSGTRDGRPDCPNRYQSILSSSYFTLVNLFGEFPLVTKHNTAGRFIGVFTAVVAVAVFAIPTGIFGAGFEEMVRKRRQGKMEALANDADMPDPNEQIEPSDGPPGETDSTAMQFLDAKTNAGKTYRTIIVVTVIITVLAFFVSTLDDVQRGNVAGAIFGLGVVEVLTVTLFTFDYVARIISAALTVTNAKSGAMRYVFSFYGVIDLLSVLPFFLGLPSYGLGNVSYATGPTLTRSLRLIRMLKLERYVKAFTVFDDVLRDNLDILAVSGFFALVAWIFASSLLYFTESNGPDPDVSVYYQSVPMAMWVTLVNLAGEAPLADYTVAGKIITGMLGVFGVGVFAVPVGLLGAGFQEWVESVQSKEPIGSKGIHLPSERMTVNGEVMGDLDLMGESEGNLRDKPRRKQLYAFLEARTPWGRRFETFIMIIIFVTVTQAIVMTMPSVCADETHCPSSFDWVELAAIVIFTVEYFLRIYAAPEAYPDKSPWMARLRYSVSFYAVIDFLAVFPYYVARLSPSVDEYDNYLRLLRLLRILKLDKYNPCVSLIDDVFRLKARGLLVAGFAWCVMLAWFGTAMYLVERKDYDVQISCFYEGQRFSSVWNSLQYDLILLTGDYPLIDFTVVGRFVNFVQIVVAVGVVAVPSGLIANGFIQVLEETRKAKREKRRKAATYLQKQIRGHLARRQFLMVVEDAVEREAQRKRERELRNAEAERHLSQVEQARRVCYRFSMGITRAGQIFDAFVGILIMLNVVAVIAESEPSLGSSAGPSGATMQAFFDGFEAFSVLVFTVEIIMRLFIAPISPRFNFSRWNYACSFFGFVDIVSIAPWYIEMILNLLGISFDASVFRVLRLFRILQLENFVSAFTLLDDVWRSSRATLAATGLLAIVVWVGSACLYYLSEKNNECTGDAFKSIPDSMFYTAVFLAGEWAQYDFTWPGKILCCVLCIMGIALFAIPVGTVFEAFNDVLAEVHAEGDNGEQDKGDGDGYEVNPDGNGGGSKHDGSSGSSYTDDGSNV